MPQVNHLLTPKEKSTTSIWWKGAKAVATILILSYVWNTIQKEHKVLLEAGRTFDQLIEFQSFPFLLVLIVLVPMNWALESYKWMLLARKAVPVTFGEAFRSTLTGLALGVAIPAQLGDTLGRITSLRSDNRLKTLGAALVSNGIQFYASLLGGATSWVVVSPYLSLAEPVRWAISSFLSILVAAGVFAGVYRSRLLGWKSERPWALKLKKNLAVIGQYSSTELAFTFGLGLARYFVFVGQFALALSLFSLNIPPLKLFGCIGLILLTKTLLPVINAVGDLGIREFTALYVFAPFQLPEGQIIVATFLIWLVNILAPLLVGLFFVWKYKWSTRYV